MEVLAGALNGVRMKIPRPPQGAHGRHLALLVEEIHGIDQP